jgi:polyisoprenoid-binding protein YceI
MKPALETRLPNLPPHAAVAAPATTAWEIDSAHTTAGFSVRHMMVAKVRGRFEQVRGTVHLDDADPTRSRLDIAIDAASIDTRNAQRDAHLKSPDFFDVAQYPSITFRSTQIEKVGPGSFQVTGDLTMRGVTRPVTLAVEGPTSPLNNPFGKQVRGVSATGKLNRKDWGLNWNAALETGGVLVGEQVELEIDAELVQDAAPVTGAQ